MQKQLNIVFIGLTFLVILFLLIPNIFQEGLFMDGLIYSTTGLNLANGTGSFWKLSFTKTVISNFDGHPPLAIYLQSFFFKLLGDSYSIEKFYSFVTAVVTGFLMVLTWNFFHHSKQKKKLYWLPILLWITIPVCFWSYQNNVLETTMGVFTLGASLVSLYSLDKKGITKYGLLLLSAILMVLGFLTKGFPAFFPLAIFGLHFIVYKRKSIGEVLINSFFVLLSIAFILLLIFWDESARTFIFNYLDIQVIDSLKGNKVVDPRTFIIIRLLRELTAPFLLLIIIFLSAFFIKKEGDFSSYYSKDYLKDSLFLILIGLSASLPIAISPKQMGFYLLPSLPFFVMAISTLIAPLIVSACSKKISFTFFYSAGILFFISLFSIFIYAHFNAVNPSRDKQLLQDVRAIGSYLEKESTIGLKQTLFPNWSLIGYLQRYYLINVEPEGSHQFILTDKQSPIEKENYMLEIETEGLLLYSRQDLKK